MAKDSKDTPLEGKPEAELNDCKGERGMGRGRKEDDSMESQEGNARTGWLWNIWRRRKTRTLSTEMADIWNKDVHYSWAPHADTPAEKGKPLVKCGTRWWIGYERHKSEGQAKITAPAEPKVILYMPDTEYPRLHYVPVTPGPGSMKTVLYGQKSLSAPLSWKFEKGS